MLCFARQKIIKKKHTSSDVRSSSSKRSVSIISIIGSDSSVNSRVSDSNNSDGEKEEDTCSTTTSSSSSSSSRPWTKMSRLTDSELDEMVDASLWRCIQANNVLSLRAALNISTVFQYTDLSEEVS